MDNNLNIVKKILILFIFLTFLYFFTFFKGNDDVKNEENFTSSSNSNSVISSNSISNKSKSSKKSYNLSEDIDYNLINEAYKVIKEKYYGIDEVSTGQIVDGIIAGMVESLGDKHSEYMTEKEQESFNETLAGNFEGIGVVVEKNEQYGILITQVLKETPASEAGLKAGDIIIKADENDIKDVPLQEAITYIRGEAGTTVNLSIVRDGEIFEKEIMRKLVNVPSVYKEIYEEDRIAHISLNMFGDNTSLEFKNILNELDLNKIDGIIIDLRENGGGYLNSAVEILSNFIEDNKVLVQVKFNNGHKDEVYTSKNKGEIFDKKIVILVDEYTASASEITAGALKDHQKAILIGVKTYGKGSVQEPYYLSNGGLLKITIANWYTPNGINIDSDGIVPDIEVKFTENDFKNLYDRQLEEAKKVLKMYVENGNITSTIDLYNSTKVEDDKEENIVDSGESEEGIKFE